MQPCLRRSTNAVGSAATPGCEHAAAAAEAAARAQELLAAQLIRAFADIFADSGLPLQLRPYEVLVTSNRTALIELVPDSLSVHQARGGRPLRLLTQ